MHFMPKAQEIYRHFKGNLYQIITIAEHSETGEALVIYQALYGSFKIYARPLSMFVEKVDKEKYPESAQEYRFELQQAVEQVSQDVVGQSTMAEAVVEQAVVENVYRKPDTVEQNGSTQNDRIPAPQKQVETATEPSEEFQLDPLLLQFLDADTYEERLNILAALHHRITDDMITTMAIASDIEVPEGDIETRYTELRNCLLTLEKYEINRLG